MDNTAATQVIPFDLATYLAGRDQQRQDRFEQMNAALTEREQRLVHEAAVMGFIQGRESGRENPVPKDSVTARQVLLAADAFGDLFPTLSALGTNPTD